MRKKDNKTQDLNLLSRVALFFIGIMYVLEDKMSDKTKNVLSSFFAAATLLYMNTIFSESEILKIVAEEKDKYKTYTGFYTVWAVQILLPVITFLIVFAITRKYYLSYNV